MVWDDWQRSGSSDEKEVNEKKTFSVTRAELAIVVGMWMLSLCVLTKLMLSTQGHLYSSEKLLFVCTHPVTHPMHSLRTHPGQGSSFNSGHLLLLNIEKLYQDVSVLMSHF